MAVEGADCCQKLRSAYMLRRSAFASGLADMPRATNRTQGSSPVESEQPMAVLVMRSAGKPLHSRITTVLGLKNGTWERSFSLHAGEVACTSNSKLLIIHDIHGTKDLRMGPAFQVETITKRTPRLGRT